MALGYLLVAIVAAAVAVFALQNSAPTSVRFLVWTTEDIPVSALVLASLAAGLVVAGVPLWIQRWRLRSRTRTLEARVRMLEGAVDERQRATLSQPPPPPRQRAHGE
jgi:uncharacterized integral membrane protein